MKFKWINFFLLYILVPAIVIPYLTTKSGNWFGLFGILLYFIGLLIAKFKQWVFLPIPLLFCFWYWYTYGFSPRDYVYIYLACMLCGLLFGQVSIEYYKYVNKVLPEQLNNFEYNAKIEELNIRLEKFRKEHPNEKLTPEIVEKIRTDIFF